MGDLVPHNPKPLAELNLQPLEPLVVQLAAIREEAATSFEPSEVLLEKLGAGLKLVEGLRSSLGVAAQPLRHTDVATFLGMLQKSYPNGGQQDARVYGRFLREDIMSLQPTVGAMEFACRRWRQKSRFLPAISEMMAEVKVARDELAGALEFAAKLPALHARMAQDLGRPS